MSIVWWSGVSKLLDGPLKHLLSRTAGLRKEYPDAGIDLNLPYVPVDWRFALFDSLGLKLMCVLLSIIRCGKAITTFLLLSWAWETTDRRCQLSPKRI